MAKTALERNKAYWEGRFTQLEKANHKSSQELLSEIDRQYRTAQKEIEGQTARWYQRFATNNGIDLREAKRLLGTKELAEFKWTASEYAKYGRENAINGGWVKQLENASARFHVTRLQALQMEQQQTIEKLFGGQLDGLDAHAKQLYLDTYFHTAFEVQHGLGVGFDIVGIDDKSLARIITTPWATDGRNFSERIWTNKNALIGEVRTQLSQNLMMGKSPDESIKAIADKFGVSERQAGRLVMTESAYFASLAQYDSYVMLGIQFYQIVATLDDRTSTICRDLDGQVYDLKDYQAGSTAPPFHPWCRTVTAPYYKDMEGMGQRAARENQDTKTYYVPRDMTYHDWEKTFTQGGTKQGLTPVPAGAVRDYACELAAKFGKGYYDKMRDIVDDCPDEDLKKLWLQHEREIAVGDANYSGYEHCTGNTIYVNGGHDEKGSTWEKPFQVTFHESGHAIDSLNVQKGGTSPGHHFSARYKNGLFPQTIKDEVGEIVKAKDVAMKQQFKAHSTDYDWLHSHGYIGALDYNWYEYYGRFLSGTPKYSKSMAYKAIEKEINNFSPFQKGDLSDIMEGATSARIQVGFGHGEKYWKDRTYNGVSDGLATESFAEMIDSTMTNPEGLKLIQAYLPKSYAVFKEMVKSLVP
ncbi:MAG: minor capsid protein [Kiritimatiellia bacterium]